MSDPLQSVALVGTARAHDQATLTGTPVDDLIAGLGDITPERALLLRAGARSIYREAGQIPVRHAEPLPAPAPAETQPLCAPAVASLISALLGGSDNLSALLAEALERLGRAGQRVPPDLLPAIFAARPTNATRPQWRQVIGARGRWLAQFNSAWRWATEPPVVGEAGEAIPADAATIWQEGTPTQRNAILAQVRAVDPALARDWLAATWKQEKADARVEWLTILATNLEPADEALLEIALNDKVARVRETAADLLARLPASAFMARMTARADALLTWQGDHLTIAPLPPFDPAWQRDGMTATPPQGFSKHDWALCQIVARVPPTHWTLRSGLAPAACIAAAQETDDYAVLVQAGRRRRFASVTRRGARRSGTGGRNPLSTPILPCATICWHACP